MKQILVRGAVSSSRSCRPRLRLPVDRCARGSFVRKCRHRDDSVRMSGMPLYEEH